MGLRAALTNLGVAQLRRNRTNPIGRDLLSQIRDERVKRFFQAKTMQPRFVPAQFPQQLYSATFQSGPGGTQVSYTPQLVYDVLITGFTVNNTGLEPDDSAFDITIRQIINDRAFMGSPLDIRFVANGSDNLYNYMYLPVPFVMKSNEQLEITITKKDTPSSPFAIYDLYFTMETIKVERITDPCFNPFSDDDERELRKIELNIPPRNYWLNLSAPAVATDQISLDNKTNKFGLPLIVLGALTSSRHTAVRLFNDAGDYMTPGTTFVHQSAIFNPTANTDGTSGTRTTLFNLFTKPFYLPPNDQIHVDFLGVRPGESFPLKASFICTTP